MWRKTVSGVILICLCVGISILTFNVQPSFCAEIDWWPTFQHDNRHTGFSTSSAPNTNSTLWISEYVGSIGGSSAIAVNGKVFIGTNAGNDSANRQVVAFDENTGNILWRYWTGYQFDSTPAFGDGKIFISMYTGLPDGEILALDENTGTLKWKNRVAAGHSSPTYADGKVFIGSYDADGSVYCFDAVTGGILLKTQATEGYIWGSPAVCDGKI